MNWFDWSKALFYSGWRIIMASTEVIHAGFTFTDRGRNYCADLNIDMNNRTLFATLHPEGNTRYRFTYAGTAQDIKDLAEAINELNNAFVSDFAFRSVSGIPLHLSTIRQLELFPKQSSSQGLVPQECYEIPDFPELVSLEEYLSLGRLVVRTKVLLPPSSREMVEKWRHCQIPFRAFPVNGQMILIEECIPTCPENDPLATTIASLRVRANDYGKMVKSSTGCMGSRLGCSPWEIEQMVIPTTFGNSTRVRLPLIMDFLYACNLIKHTRPEWLGSRREILQDFWHNGKVRKADHFAHPREVGFRLVAELDVVMDKGG